MQPGKAARAKPILCTMAVLCCLACLPSQRAHAQSVSHEFEGVWIWDPAEYVPPPNLPGLNHMTGETMSVSRDDGAHFTGPDPAGLR